MQVQYWAQYALQQNYLSKMNKNNIAIREILSKREKKAKSYLNQTMPVEVNSSLATGKEIPFQTILDKLVQASCSQPTKFQLTNEEKYSIIELISEKEQASFNRHTLAALLTVWKFPGSRELQLQESSAKKNGLRETGLKHYKNYFVLRGKLNLYDRKNISIHKENNGNGFRLSSEEDDAVFGTETKCEVDVQILTEEEPLCVIEQFAGWGPLFKKKEERKNVSLIACDAIVVELKNPQFEGMLINLGGMDQEKKAKFIEGFPIFSSIGKRIQSILPYIGLKHYTRNQPIYKAKQMPHAIYLIIKGQVIFEMRVAAKKQNDKRSQTFNVNDANCSPIESVFQTETLGVNNYFGEEEVLAKCERKLTSTCYSAECELLEIPIEKFEKLLANSDFQDIIKANSVAKVEKREEKINKAIEVYLNLQKNNEKEVQDSSADNPGHGSERIGKKKKVQIPKIMHGNVIKRVRTNNSSDDVKFSMLQANPDMYAATMKKFRKFTMKPVEKYKPDVNWNLKRVWKVLNLENVLREDAEVNSPEGRKFYESHRRYQNHVNEVKSLRPKTSSSTYRTKLQYIAYLQQFNN